MIEKLQRQLQIGAWVLVAVFILTAVLLWQNVGRTSKSGNVSDTIAISGTGKVFGKPDIALAEIAISVEASTATAAQDLANKKSNAVVDYLKKSGIEDKDVQTNSYNISPQYDYTNGRSQIRGYQVSQSLTVKVRNLDQANTILDGVVDAGANQVNGLRFEIDKPEKLKSDARKMAIDDANTKMRELAGQLGISLGHIVGFSESGDAQPPIMYATGLAKAADAAASIPAPALPVGENEITSNVTITYQIR